jgi:phosphatidylserine decarboxylase
MGKLTKEVTPKQTPIILTDRREVPFEIVFKYQLERDFTFNEFSRRNLKEFQRFLDKVSRMTVRQVDEVFGCLPDKTDTGYGKRIQHYAVTDSFRIHTILEEGRYVMIRLDSNHKVHR